MLRAVHVLITRAAWFVIITTVIAIVLAGYYGSSVVGRLQPDDGQPVKNAESTKVTNAITDTFKERGASGIILFTAKDPSFTADDKAYRAEVTRLLEGLKGATNLNTYYSTGSDTLVSRDRSQTFATVTLPGNDQEQFERLTEFQETSQSSRLKVDVGGQIVAQKQISEQIEKDLTRAEIVTLPILAILLLVFFRSVVAAMIPLLLGAIAIIGGLGVTRLLSEFTDIQQYAINIITVLGLGLSVDYSLLMVSRYREELARKGATPDSAIERTVATSGHTIFFSGLTVMMSLLALLVFPIGFLRSVALGGASALVVAMVAALVVLPAILHLVGRNIDRLRIVRRSPSIMSDPTRGIWGRIGALSMRAPFATLLISSAVIIAAAAPLGHIVFRTFDYRSLPAQQSAHYVGEQLIQKFVDQQPPVQVLVQFKQDATAPESIKALYDLTSYAEERGGVSKVVSPTPTGLPGGKDGMVALYAAPSLPPPLSTLAAQNISGTSALLSVYYDGEPNETTAQNLVSDLRAYDAGSALLRVGGQPAVFYDTMATIKRFLPLALAIIAISMYVLLMLLLRSLWLPLQAVAINSFALFAAFGVLVSVFQDNFLTDVTWFRATGGLDPSIPVLIGAISFGLSMDYAAFLYSRIREEYDAGYDARVSVVRGLGFTGPIISAAAVVFFVVVVAFGVSSIPIIQQVGLGLSLAVLIDAFIVRILFVPAVMRLFGRHSWYWPIRGSLGSMLRSGIIGASRTPKNK